MKGWLICKLNDELRNTFTGGKVVMTDGSQLFRSRDRSTSKPR